MPAKEKTLNDLFLDGLKDLYHAEKQQLRSLAKMSKAVNSEQLREAFETHRTETESQIERLEQVFEMIQKRPQGKPCEAMQGLVEESKEIMEDYKNSPALDAGILSSAQAAEHYEIARYGTMRTWANQLGMQEAIGLIEQSLQEEKKTDELLTRIAEQSANLEAESGGEEESEEEEAPQSSAKGKRKSK